MLDLRRLRPFPLFPWSSHVFDKNPAGHLQESSHPITSATFSHCVAQVDLHPFQPGGTKHADCASNLRRRLQRLRTETNISWDTKWHRFCELGQYAPCMVYLRANPPVRPHNFLGILKEYKFRPPLNFTFNWEDQQGYLEYRFPPPLHFTFNWEDQQR